MTKADLVDQVVALGDLTRRDGEVIVETLFESIVGALKSDDKVEVRGFGSFRTRKRNSRTGRNPKTGATVEVPAKRVPFFKPSKDLRDQVNPPGEGARRAAGSKGPTGSKGIPGNKGSTGGSGEDAGSVDPHHPPPM